MIKMYRVLKLVILPLLYCPTHAAPPFPAVAAGVGAGAMGVSPPEVTDAIKKALSFNFTGTNVWLQEVRIKQANESDPKKAGPINNNSPVLIHVIIFYDDNGRQRIGEMNSDEYFKNAKQIERDYRSTIEIFEIDVPPGVKIDPVCISPKNVMGTACGIFARYDTPGAHRYNVGSDRIIEIELGANDFKVNTIKQ